MARSSAFVTVHTKCGHSALSALARGLECYSNVPDTSSCWPLRAIAYVQGAAASVHKDRYTYKVPFVVRCGSPVCPIFLPCWLQTHLMRQVTNTHMYTQRLKHTHGASGQALLLLDNCRCGWNSKLPAAQGRYLLIAAADIMH